MPRTLTAAQASTLARADYQVIPRLRIASTGGAGPLVDYTSFLIAHAFDDDVDSSCRRATFTLAREDGPLQSLSPLMDQSELNQPTPALNLVRQIVFDTAVLPPGTSLPQAGDWIEMFRGTIDRVEFSHTIELTCRDLGGILEDWIIDEEETYLAETGLDELIQQILDDNEVVVFGVPVVLYAPVPTAAGLEADRIQERGSLMEAIRTLAGGAGDVVRFRYDSANQFRLTRYTPERENPTVDLTIGPHEYGEISQLLIEKDDLRTRVRVEYSDLQSPPVRQGYTASAPPSVIAEYGGYRSMIIVEGSDSPIRTLAQAQTFAESALSDLMEPWATHDVELFWAPQLQIGDYLELEPNGVHYDTPQFAAVVALRGEYSQERHRMVATLRGKPSGAFRRWLMFGQQNVVNTTLTISAGKNSTSVGPTPPAGAVEGDVWWDTAAGTVAKRFDGVGWALVSPDALSNLTAVLGTVYAGLINNLSAAPTRGVRLDGSSPVPPTWVDYIDLAALGTAVMAHLGQLEILANGQATFGGRILIREGTDNAVIQFYNAALSALYGRVQIWNGIVPQPGGTTATTQGVRIDSAAGAVVLDNIRTTVIGHLFAFDDAVIGGTAKQVGFYGTPPVAKPTVTGSRGGNAALTSLLAALHNLGLITNSSS